MSGFPKMLYTEDLEGEELLMCKTKWIIVFDEDELSEKLDEGYRVELEATKKREVKSEDKPKRKRRTKAEIEADKAKEAE